MKLRKKKHTWSIITGWSTSDSTKFSKVIFLTRPLPTFGPAKALILAPFCAFVILMFLNQKHKIRNSNHGLLPYLASTFSTISNTPGYWPRDLNCLSQKSGLVKSITVKYTPQIYRCSIRCSVTKFKDIRLETHCEPVQSRFSTSTLVESWGHPISIPKLPRTLTN